MFLRRLPFSLRHRSEDGVVAADAGAVLVVLRFRVAHLIKFRLQEKENMLSKKSWQKICCHIQHSTHEHRIQ